MLFRSKRKVGRPLKENERQVGANFSGAKTAQIIGEQAGDSTRQVERFIRLNKLTPDLMQLLPCRNPCAAASTKDNDAMRPCHTAAAERPPLGFVAGAAARLCDERADTMIHPSALSQDCGGLPWLAVPMAAQAAQEAGVRPYRVQIRPASGELCRIGCKLNRSAERV